MDFRAWWNTLAHLATCQSKTQIENIWDILQPTRWFFHHAISPTKSERAQIFSLQASPGSWCQRQNPKQSTSINEIPLHDPTHMLALCLGKARMCSSCGGYTQLKTNSPSWRNYRQRTQNWERQDWVLSDCHRTRVQTLTNTLSECTGLDGASNALHNLLVLHQSRTKHTVAGALQLPTKEEEQSSICPILDLEFYFRLPMLQLCWERYTAIRRNKTAIVRPEKWCIPRCDRLM